MRNKFLKIPYHELTIRCFVKYFLSRYSILVYIELSHCFVPTVVLKKERSELRD